jgi:serum/glucocorticoid-regulated kinase 2
MQVRKIDDGKIYAMKVLKKKTLVKRKQVVHTQTERKVLAAIDNPFIVSLRYAFQSEAKLYMILDFFNGGELFFHLKKDGRFSEKRSRFYAGEICVALECLHLRAIIYRDLKPENILLDADGHIKITDFGLSKESVKGDAVTHTFCGTPEYLAPEVLQQQGHGKAVDWWSFGTLLYEMMTGLPPFYNQNLNVMYEKILHAPIPLPKYLSKEARSVFLGLLERDPRRRLGSSKLDASEIKEHPFFKPLDFERLARKELKPPYKPRVKNELDVGNIEDEFTCETPKDTPVINTGSMLAAKDAFVGFTYDQNSSILG